VSLFLVIGSGDARLPSIRALLIEEKNMSRKIHTLAALAAVALAGSAFADDKSGAAGVDVKAGITMQSADTNADGMVSKAEAAANAQLAQKFDTYDANKDGNLDKAEFAKFEAEGKGKAKAKSGKSEEAPAKGSTSDQPPAPKE
jgi:hypothetical protein